MAWWGSSGRRSLVGRAGAINNSGKNRTPLKLGSVEEKQPSTGGGSTLCTYRKGRRSRQSMGAQEPCGGEASALSSLRASEKSSPLWQVKRKVSITILLYVSECSLASKGGTT